MSARARWCLFAVLMVPAVAYAAYLLGWWS